MYYTNIRIISLKVSIIMMNKDTEFTTLDVTTKKHILGELLMALRMQIYSIKKDVLKDSPYYDLALSDVMTIDVIGNLEAPQTKEISTTLNTSKSTFTARLHNLEQKGYIQRTCDQADHRSIRVTLTERGKSLYYANKYSHSMLTNAFMKDMNEQELNDIYTALIENVPQALFRCAHKYRD